MINDIFQFPTILESHVPILTIKRTLIRSILNTFFMVGYIFIRSGNFREETEFPWFLLTLVFSFILSLQLWKKKQENKTEKTRNIGHENNKLSCGRKRIMQGKEEKGETEEGMKQSNNLFRSMIGNFFIAFLSLRAIAVTLACFRSKEEVFRFDRLAVDVSSWHYDLFT